MSDPRSPKGNGTRAQPKSRGGNVTASQKDNSFASPPNTRQLMTDLLYRIPSPNRWQLCVGWQRLPSIAPILHSTPHVTTQTSASLQMAWLSNRLSEIIPIHLNLQGCNCQLVPRLEQSNLPYGVQSNPPNEPWLPCVNQSDDGEGDPRMERTDNWTGLSSKPSERF